MKKIGLIGAIIAVLFLSLIMVSCPEDDPVVKDDDDRQTGPGQTGPTLQPKPALSPPISGTAKSSAPGYASGYIGNEEYPEYQNGDTYIDVTVTLTDGLITSVLIEEKHESAGYGRDLARKLGLEIVKYNSFDIKVIADAIAKATVTFNGIKTAGEAAIAQIKAANAAKIEFDSPIFFMDKLNEAVEIPHTKTVPAGATLVWKSSNEAVATISETGGLITGKTAGTTVVTATLTDGANIITAKCLVVVE